MILVTLITGFLGAYFAYKIFDNFSGAVGHLSKVLSHTSISIEISCDDQMYRDK